MKELLLYSGGYDSVALLYIILKHKKTTDLTVIFEKGNDLQYEIEEKMARKAYRYLLNKHKRDGLTVRWITQNINLDWVDNENRSTGGDILLPIHLMTALINCPYDAIYTGWHKTNLSHLKFTKQLMKWFESIKRKKVDLFFMEDFIKGHNPHECKINTVSYLLQNNLFQLPYSSLKCETEIERSNRDTWYEYNGKERELSIAIAGQEVFKDGSLLSQAFSCKSTIDVQKFYNKLTNRNKKEILRPILNKEN